VTSLDGIAFLVGHTETVPEVAVAVCGRLRATIESHDWQRIAAGLRVTVTIAWCEVGGGSNRSDPIARATHALHAAQQHGRNQVARPH
jgi:PleD family two-component response regulator